MILVLLQNNNLMPPPLPLAPWNSFGHSSLTVNFLWSPFTLCQLQLIPPSSPVRSLRKPCDLQNPLTSPLDLAMNDD